MLIPFANPLQPLIDVLEEILLFFHDTIGVGWGLAIILLTVRCGLSCCRSRSSRSRRCSVFRCWRRR